MPAAPEARVIKRSRISAVFPQSFHILTPTTHARIPRVTVPVAVDLSVNVGALRLSNPILAASGTFGYGVEFAHLLDLNRLGGIVVKGLSLEPIAGAPAPRLCETPSGMLNAVGLQNIGVRAFVAEKLPALRQYRTAVIANVFGYSIDEYVGVIRVLEDAEGIAAYELNISCPNTSHGGIQFGSDPQMITEVVSGSPAGLSPASLGQALAKRGGYRGNGPGRRKCRSGCPHGGKHLPGHEYRRPDPEIEIGPGNGRLIRPSDQTSYPATGVRSEPRREDSDRWFGRDRKGGRCPGICHRWGLGSTGRNGQFFPSYSMFEHLRSAGKIV